MEENWHKVYSSPFVHKAEIVSVVLKTKQITKMESL